MPNSCCAVACSNRKSKDTELQFYRFPKDQKRRKLWLHAVKRDSWGDNKSLKYARLCSAHFISGMFTTRLVSLFNIMISEINQLYLLLSLFL